MVMTGQTRETAGERVVAADRHSCTSRRTTNYVVITQACAGRHTTMLLPSCQAQHKIPPVQSDLRAAVTAHRLARKRLVGWPAALEAQQGPMLQQLLLIAHAHTCRRQGHSCHGPHHKARTQQELTGAAQLLLLQLTHQAGPHPAPCMHASWAA